MAAEVWSLETGGVRKTLAQWNVSMDFQMSFQNKSKCTAQLRTMENFDPVATQWGYLQPAIIRRDETIYLRGYFDDPEMSADSSGQSIRYRLHNAWWLLELNAFKQYRNRFVRFSATSKRIVAVSVNTPGSGYHVGDTVVVPGFVGDRPATYHVVTVNGTGGIVLVWPTNGGGSYAAAPSSPIFVTGGGLGSGGCKLALVTGPAPVTTTEVLSEVFLGENLHVSEGYTVMWPNGNGDQIGEVIDWLNGLDWASQGITGPVLQKGIIDPHTMMPITRTNSVFCSEAIHQCLRWDPDAVIQIDDTTSPPTFNVRKLAKWDYSTVPPTFIDYSNLPEVTINITATQEKQIQMQGQQSKQWNGIIIYYKSVDEIDNAIYPSTITDKFPPGITDFTPFVMVQTIELQGAKVTHAIAQVAVNTDAPFGLLLSTNVVDQANWWKAHDQTLRDTKVAAATIAVVDAPVITDEQGHPIDASFANELKGTTCPTWVGSTIKAIVRQTLSFKRYKDDAHTILDAATNNRLHTKAVVLVNRPAGIYSTLSSVATAEPVPQNVAQSCYRTLSAQQWAGSITFVDKPLRSDITLGKRLKLVGPKNTFTNLVVQAIEQRPAYGETTVTYGPGPLVDIDLWIEFARASRNRITWNLPSDRGDGGAGGGGNQSSAVDVGSNAPVEDTAHSIGGHGYFSVIGPAP